jgi:hypothetical protein
MSAVNPDLALPQVMRPAYFPGEVLTAGVLDDAFVVERSLRWLHNRTLHDWGVGVGYTIDSAKGARVVTVHPGYAADVAGRDLVLETPVAVNVPPIVAAPDGGPAEYVLTVSYTPDADAAVERRDGTCGTNGAVRRFDDPAVRWLRPDAVREGFDIELAVGHIAGCALVAPVDTSTRRSARGGAQPLVAAGASDATATPWQPWPDAASWRGVTAASSTTVAGFAERPRYTVSIEGVRFMSDVDSPINEPFVLDGHAAVVLPTAAGFEVVCPLPPMYSAPPGWGAIRMNPAEIVTDDTAQLGVVSQLGWRVVWMGVEER